MAQSLAEIQGTLESQTIKEVAAALRLQYDKLASVAVFSNPHIAETKKIIHGDKLADEEFTNMAEIAIKERKLRFPTSGNGFIEFGFNDVNQMVAGIRNNKELNEKYNIDPDFDIDKEIPTAKTIQSVARGIFDATSEKSGFDIGILFEAAIVWLEGMFTGKRVGWQEAMAQVTAPAIQDNVKARLAEMSKDPDIDRFLNRTNSAHSAPARENDTRVLNTSANTSSASSLGAGGVASSPAASPPAASSSVTPAPAVGEKTVAQRIEDQVSVAVYQALGQPVPPQYQTQLAAESAPAKKLDAVSSTLVTEAIPELHRKINDIHGGLAQYITGLATDKIRAKQQEAEAKYNAINEKFLSSDFQAHKEIGGGNPLNMVKGSARFVGNYVQSGYAHFSPFGSPWGDAAQALAEKNVMDIFAGDQSKGARELFGKNVAKIITTSITEVFQDPNMASMDNNRIRTIIEQRIKDKINSDPQSVTITAVLPKKLANLKDELANNNLTPMGNDVFGIAPSYPVDEKNGTTQTVTDLIVQTTRASLTDADIQNMKGMRNVVDFAEGEVLSKAKAACSVKLKVEECSAEQFSSFQNGGKAPASKAATR